MLQVNSIFNLETRYTFTLRVLSNCPPHLFIFEKNSTSVALSPDVYQFLEKSNILKIKCQSLLILLKVFV